MLVERPWHMTIVGTILTLHAIESIHEDSSARCSWLVPVFAVWANVHIQFVLGLGLLGLAVGVASVGWLRGKPHQLRRLAVLMGCCGTATLLTPYHLRLYGVVWDYATETTGLRSVLELRPPDFRDWWTWPLIVLGPSAVVRVALKRFPLWESCLLAVGLFFALRMQRDGWFGVLVAGTVLIKARQPRATAGWSGTAGIPVLAAFGLAGMVWLSGLVARPSIATATEAEYPVGAAAFIEATRPPGPLFNPFDWGGFLIWELRAYPVSIDGRTNLYGDARLARSVHTWSADPGWADDPDLAAAGVIIAPLRAQGKPVRLTEELRTRPDRWRLAYEDAVTAVFVRR